MTIQQIYTGGDFESEADAWDAFDRIILANKAFRMHREVEGEYLQPRIDTEEKSPRIDRILIPLGAAVEAGWVDGAIGIEGKRSGKKIGRLISQAMDYTRAAFCLKSGPPGLTLLLKWVFVFPVEREVGDLESIMAQNRIGCATVYNRGIRFTCGGSNALVLGEDGTVAAKQLPMGRKRGSR